MENLLCNKKEYDRITVFGLEIPRTVIGKGAVYYESGKSK